MGRVLLEQWGQPRRVGLFADDALVWAGVEHQRIGERLQDARQRLQQHLDPLLGRQTGGDADGRPPAQAMLIGKGAHDGVVGLIQGDRRRDDDQLAVEVL